MKWNRKYLLGAAVTASAVVGGVALTPRGLETVGSARADVMSMLGARSPGARVEGAMTTKGPRMALARTSRVLPVSQGPAPRQSAVLPISAPAPKLPAVAALGTPAPIAATPLLGSAPVFAAAPAAIGGGGLGAAALLPIPVAAALLVPGGGGGGGPISVPDTTPAIPEPATWLMMIMGFGFLGMWLRQRRRMGLENGRSIGLGKLGAVAA